jgi:hypothetical protein
MFFSHENGLSAARFLATNVVKSGEGNVSALYTDSKSIKPAAP